MEEIFITRKYLSEHPEEIFVFGDNKLRRGSGGAAKLRDMPNVYGFITKKVPSHDPESYYRPREYKRIYDQEVKKLQKKLTDMPETTFLITKLGGGLANKYKIFQKIIEPRIKEDLKDYSNVKFLW